jgi:hypothetical protein
VKEIDKLLHSTAHILSNYIEMTHYKYLNTIFLICNISTSSFNQYMTHQQSNSFPLYYLPHHHQYYIKFKMINLIYIVSILNFIFTVMFCAARWPKLYPNCICFEEFLNQLNLLYICMFIFVIEQDMCVMRLNGLLQYRSIVRRLSTNNHYLQNNWNRYTFILLSVITKILTRNTFINLPKN